MEKSSEEKTTLARKNDFKRMKFSLETIIKATQHTKKLNLDKINYDIHIPLINSNSHLIHFYI